MFSPWAYFNLMLRSFASKCGLISPLLYHHAYPRKPAKTQHYIITGIDQPKPRTHSNMFTDQDFEILCDAQASAHIQGNNTITYLRTVLDLEHACVNDTRLMIRLILVLVRTCMSLDLKKSTHPLASSTRRRLHIFNTYAYQHKPDVFTNDFSHYIILKMSASTHRCESPATTMYPKSLCLPDRVADLIML